MFFMPHAFSQNERPFSQCGHFSQVKPFEKPWFLIVSTWCQVHADGHGHIEKYGAILFKAQTSRVWQSIDT